MKIAAPYTNDRRWKDIPDEYNIKYTDTSNTKKILEFCKIAKENNKRVNIEFVNEPFNIEGLKEATEKYQNIFVRVMYKDMPNFQILNENNIPFFFGFPCYSASLLDSLISMGTTDIYVYDELCYNLPKIKNKNINLRLVINKIASLNPAATTDIKAPFFAPNDIKELSKYIDTIEFDCFNEDNIYDWHLFNVLYKIWIKESTWFGGLEEINKDLQLHIPCDGLIPNCFTHKMNCGRRCSYNSNCDHCDKVLSLALTMEEKGLYIKGKNSK